MRTLTAGAIAALSAAQVPIILLVEMGFTPVLRMATSAVDIDWSGNTYLRTGNLGAVEVIRDTAGDAQALQFSLSGVPSENIALSLGTSARNKTCTIRLAILNATTHAIEDVSTVGVYQLDQLAIAGSTISVTAVPLARVFARPKPLRYTDADQQKVSAGDRSLEMIVSQATGEVIWPAASWGRQ
jgi:hypothetical protein